MLSPLSHYYLRLNLEAIRGFELALGDLPLAPRGCPVMLSVRVPHQRDRTLMVRLLPCDNGAATAKACTVLRGPEMKVPHD